MKISLAIAATAFMVSGTAWAQDEMAEHEPNYLLGCFLIAVAAAVVSYGKRPFLEYFAKFFVGFLVIGIAGVFVSSAIRRLDIAFGDSPETLIFAVLAVFIAYWVIKRLRRPGSGPDA